MLQGVGQRTQRHGDPETPYSGQRQEFSTGVATILIKAVGDMEKDPAKATDMERHMAPLRCNFVAKQLYDALPLDANLVK